MDVKPWRTGKFTIGAGLKPLLEKPVFEQEDAEEKYLQNKITTRKESLEKLYPSPVGLSPEELSLVAGALAERLARDRPGFKLNNNFPARDPVDLIISQVPEDFSIWKMQHHREWLALIHLSSPNHWDARDKIGKSFLEAHLPIPHIDPVSKAAPTLFRQIQTKGAFERYAWGVATDERLNHHPEPPPGISQDEWRGRSFDRKDPQLFIRMERQTLFPINHELIGFTIKTTFTDVTSLSVEDRNLIIQCLAGMDEEILKYKGLITDRAAILSWLSSLC
jgi:dimethylamine monooxygenase subunit A